MKTGRTLAELAAEIDRQNAVTRHSQDVESYDRATDLGAAGYSILTMHPKLWSRINAEASAR